MSTTELGCTEDTKFGGNTHCHPFPRFHCLYDPARENRHKNPINTGGKHCCAPAEMEQSLIHSIHSNTPRQQNPAPPRSRFSRMRNKMLITKEMIPTQNKSPPRLLSFTCLLKPDLNKILNLLRNFFCIYYIIQILNIQCTISTILHIVLYNR